LLAMSRKRCCGLPAKVGKELGKDLSLFS